MICGLVYDSLSQDFRTPFDEERVQANPGNHDAGALVDASEQLQQSQITKTLYFFW